MKTIYLFFILAFASVNFSHAQQETSSCSLLDGILDDDLASRTYAAIKREGMERRLYCSKDNYLMLGYKENPQGHRELQVGMYYRVESVENNSYAERKAFAKAVQKIYKSIKGNEKEKPRVSFRFFLVSNAGTYALGKITYNAKGKPWPYTNEKNKNTTNDYNIFPWVESGSSYTSDIIW